MWIFIYLLFFVLFVFNYFKVNFSCDFILYVNILICVFVRWGFFNKILVIFNKVDNLKMFNVWL